MDDCLAPILALRLLFLATASIVLLVYAIPPFRTRFLAYGSRAPTGQSTPASRSNNVFARLLDHLATYRVPHAWFTHFYVLSVFCSLFWLCQYALGGSLLGSLASKATQTGTASMSTGRLQVAWALMLVQGLRRLYESIALSKPSTSKMWITHWLLGLLFYGGMSAAVWIEGSPALHVAPGATSQLPSDVKTLLGIGLFGWASAKQHESHVHLASLRKYTLPTQSSFRHIVCPHYTFECLIYLALSFVAAPEGQWLNKTVLCALIFVAVNLGVTADGTKEWYAAKFGEDGVKERARMVPFIW
ncbi:uncharacterized protein K452DRAFT_289614 [Aplosporella prunicola CBS 121167]|uniref:Polyprenal reductase n=1 Tax=Aplosporella prunicola CBS 121167 TaxID=1176127 RepID=A0A6A6B8L5_9PEZI|nr:uncharacterized protein K452DRAFT_289614 [Aplosporella prunicola CBS 121167]KAF2139615.1 hypothetical protein K452DRAFT_289614 [Aplosporella prunicola CBS 121167]